MSRRIAFACLITIASLAPALAVSAQEAPPAQPAQPAAQPAQRVGIEEIVVTARKVSENLQETPLAVSAFDSELLSSMGVSDTRDISAIAPNLYFTQTPGSVANLALAIRGIGGAEPLLTREQGVAVYMDGAYIARVTGAIMDLVDIERVEVLRGPQGTLYGRNATGGAVNFISRRPTEDSGFTGRIGGGSYSRFEGLARINTGELLPGLAATVAYLHSQADGVVNNRLTDQNSDPGAKNSDAFRVAVGWEATENLRLDYAFDYSNLEGRDHAFQLIAVGSTIQGALNTGSGAIGGGPISLEVDDDRLDDLSLDNDGVSEHTIRGHYLTAEYDMGFATVKSITTYREWENLEEGTELDGNVLGTLLALDGNTFAPIVVSDRSLFDATNVRTQDQWTQELQLLGDLGDHFRYVAGFYYFNEDFTEENVQRFLFPFSPAAPPLAFARPFFYSGDARAWAFFANGVYTLPFLDERLSLTGGIRYSYDEKSFDRTSAAATSNSENWDSIDWEVNLSFLATDDITTYFRAATAYKAGGFNLRQTTTPILPFDEEDLTAVEGGVKMDLFDNRVRLNAAGFWSVYKDLQTDVFTAGSGGANSITINAGEAEIPGFEVELIAVPVEGLTLNANVGWIDPKYNEYNVIDNATGNLVNLADEAKFGYKPETTATIGAEYATAPLGAWGWVIAPRIDARYTSSRVWSPLDDERSQKATVITPFRDALKDDGYWLLDARLTVSEISINDRAKLKLSVFGKNITDEEYLLSGIDFGALDFAGGIFGEPATWGIDLTLDY